MSTHVCRRSLIHGLLMLMLAWPASIALAATKATAPPSAKNSPPAAAAKPRPSLADKIGLTAARKRLGPAIPTGKGVVMGHVEGGDPQVYLPNWHDKRFGKVLFVRRSGTSKVSGHATATAGIIYGPHGLAPGVGVVHCFSARDWMTDGYLHAGSAKPPADDLPRVFNHSWIGDMSRGSQQVLDRVDYEIDHNDVIMCVGVNNGRGSAVPDLLASAYNVIAVGAADGNSSGGYTRVAGKGRCKPDIVAPKHLTSMATPVVSACAARLLEAARKMDQTAGNESDDGPAEHRATHSEVVKAVLLAGATKPAKWAPQPGKPLDAHLGAGVVNINNSLLILQAGAEKPGRLKHRYGWDWRALAANGKSLYRFKTTQPMGEASIVLTWNRHVRGLTLKNPRTGKNVWGGVPSLADFDIRLVRIGTDETSLTTIAASTSLIDNVELIDVPRLDPGQYVIEVRRQKDNLKSPSNKQWDYALAWRFETASAK